MSEQPMVSPPTTSYQPASGSIIQMIREVVQEKWHSGKKIFDYVSTINELRSEIELLTSYSTDVIYRLRYDTMDYDYISPSVIRLMGYTPDEMKEINFRSLIKETRIVTDGMRKVDSFSKLEADRIKGDVSKWQADYLVQTKDGRKIWVSDISYPWFDKDGNIIGSIGSLRDITERIEAEEAVKNELTRLANTDPLTGITNRRAFFERLEDELKRIRRNGHSVSILLLDIDHFKRINDSHGHAFGDTVIKGVANIIGQCLRETDFVARLGGEEFGVFLPDTPSEGAFWVAERIRSSVEKMVFETDELKPVKCTISIGIGEARGKEKLESSELYKMADTRLYIAKNTGRNQVSMDEIIAMH